MESQPKSVTVVCWILIVTSALSLCSLLFTLSLTAHDPRVMALMSRSPLPTSVQYGIGLLSLAIAFVSGIGMLNAKAWARILYIGWNIISAAIVVATSPTKIMTLPGLIVFAILSYFLFRPRSNTYFSRVKVS